jgi:peptide/nickel transport system ATP-binding protein
VSAQHSSAPLLEIEKLEVAFPAGGGWFGRREAVHAVNGVDLRLGAGETLGIVGESGCGKSSLGQAIMGLVTPSSGTVRLAGNRLARVARRSREERRSLQMVFQDPQSSLNPRMRAWRLIAEPLMVAGERSTRALRARAAELAAEVGLRTEQLDRYPHEFSGGQRQRIAIARALAVRPEIIVLDEPTSALDVSVQAQILNLLLRLQRDHGLAYVVISHDVAMIRHVADRVAVMYLGQVVETGLAADVLAKPLHPYTRMLLAAAPSLDHPMPPPQLSGQGELPSNRILPTGCFFRGRCPMARQGCDRPQALAPVADARFVRCHVTAASAP